MRSWITIISLCVLSVSLSVHACVFTLACVSSTETAKSAGSPTTAVWTCQRWNGRIRTTRWGARREDTKCTRLEWLSGLMCALFACLLAAKRHGEQENRDLLYGGEEECWQRGETSRSQEMHRHTRTNKLFSDGLRHWKCSAGRNPLCQGVVTFGTVMYSIDSGILFQILFALHACVCVCVCVCVSSLSPTSTWC